MTGEGWTDMMYTIWHSYANHRAIIFFIFFITILFLVFFTLNLFLAVISDSFEKVNEEEMLMKRKK